MLQKKELPKLDEGFSRITFCQNESDAQDAVNMYTALGPLDSLSSGCFGKKNTDTKVQLGIMRFLRKVEVPEDGNKVMDSDTKQEYIEKEPEKVSLSAVNSDTRVQEKSEILEGAFVGGSSFTDVHTLAFPSISTSDFQFSHDKASNIIVEKVDEFLNKVKNIRVVLVDLTHGSKILSLVGAKAAQKNIDSNKFFTFVGDITQLYTKGGLRCNVIANAANWRLRPGGGGVNAAIFGAAGPSLETATKERAGTLSPGNSVVVPLPSTSPLYKREGVTHVIHVLGPNMNPKRPNFLRNDYAKGCKILREAYSSLFESFALIVRTQAQQNESGVDSRAGSSESHKNYVARNPIDHLPDGDQKIKRVGCYEPERNKKCKGLPFEVTLKDEVSIEHGRHGNSGNISAVSESNETPRSMSDAIEDRMHQKAWGSWAQALYQISMRPEQHKNNVLEISDEVVVLHDLYPKAKRHLLVLSRMKGLDRLADIRNEHLQLLRTMHAVGLKWAEKFVRDDASLIFRLGYHSVPSMRQLHLHVVSQDFDSMHLKNKKHWNSFNSDFFRDSVDVIGEIDKYGKATLNDEKLLSMELRCHRCRSAHPNIPRLKSHINNCLVPFPASLLQNDRLVPTPTSNQ